MTDTVESCEIWPHLRGVTKRTISTIRSIVSTRTSTARNSCSMNSRNGRIKSGSGKTYCRISLINWRRYLSTRDDFAAQISELQARVNFMKDLREFQAVDSVCSGRLCHVLTSPAMTSSPQVIPSREQSLRGGQRNSHGISGNVVYTSCGEFLIPGRKVLRMVTWCSRGRQDQSSLCCTEDIWFANMTSQCSQRRAKKNLWLQSKEQNRDTIPIFETCIETVDRKS